MMFVIALLLWIAPALLLGVALLWVCFGPPGRRNAQGAQEGGTERPPEGEPPTNAVAG